MNYDYDLGEILITDRSHVSTLQVFTREASGCQVWMYTNLINGRGKRNLGPFLAEIVADPGIGEFPCSKLDPHCKRGEVGARPLTTFLFRHGKKHLFWVMNTSSVTQWEFSIDQHYFYVITTDFVPIHPVKVRKLQIAIGQRYGIIVEGKPEHAYPGHNYWIRTQKAKGCGKVKFILQEAAIIRYDATNTDIPVSHHLGYPKVLRVPYCNDPPRSIFRPIVSWHVPNPFYKPKPHSPLAYSGLETEGIYGGLTTLRTACGDTGGHGRFTGNYIRWSLGHEPFWKDATMIPTNQQMLDKPFTLIQNMFEAQSPHYPHTKVCFCYFSSLSGGSELTFP